MACGATHWTNFGTVMSALYQSYCNDGDPKHQAKKRTLNHKARVILSRIFRYLLLNYHIISFVNLTNTSLNTIVTSHRKSHLRFVCKKTQQLSFQFWRHCLANPKLCLECLSWVQVDEEAESLGWFSPIGLVATKY